MKELMTKEKQETITSLELVEQINLFRSKEGNRATLQHYDLLKIIRDEFEEEIGDGKISLSSYKTSQNKEKPMFILNFNQAKQVLVRESKVVRKAVIRYLEELEKQIDIRKQQYKLPQNYVEALKQLITQVETNEELQKINSMQQQQLGELKPIKEYYDEILNSKGTMKITQIAADYDMSATKLNRILNDKGLIRKIGDQWILYSKHMGKGYTKSETYEFAKDDYKPLTVWTQKGRLKIHEILTNLGIKAHMDKTKGQKQLF